MESFKDKLSEMDKDGDTNAEFMFVAPMVATLIGMDKNEAMDIAIGLIKKEAEKQKKESEEGEKDAPVDKQD